MKYLDVLQSAGLSAGSLSDGPLLREGFKWSRVVNNSSLSKGARLTHTFTHSHTQSGLNTSNTHQNNETSTPVNMNNKTPTRKHLPC